MKKKTILILNQFYLPGYKAGGPIRSISNLVEWLGGDFNFKIITLDRDSFENESYDGIKFNDWNKVGKAYVYYLKKEDLNFRHLYKVIKETEYDVVYLNSFLNPWFSIIPIFILKYLQRIDPSKILLVPRGELSDGALDQKTIKKKVFIRAARLLRIHNGIKWQATNKGEKKEIQRYFNVSDNHIHLASNLPQKITQDHLPVVDKNEGELRIVFLSRISPKKNLDYALQVLSKIKKSEVVFDIYGGISDNKYWNYCQKLMTELPKRIKVNYRGVINNREVLNTLSKYHLFFLPTKGENFGHAIYESMMAGTPILISDQTPWVDLEKKDLGWEYSLDQKQKFIMIIELLCNENMEIINMRKKKVRQTILSQNVQDTVEDNSQMFMMMSS